MLRKLFCGLMAAGMLLATSCQQQELTPSVGEEAVVTINVGTPEIATRAFSDGESATHFQYAVYDEKGARLPDLTGEDKAFPGEATLSLKLKTGGTYSILFWAAAPNAPYTVNLDNATMEVDYSTAVSNDENRDAFYYYVQPFEVTGSASMDVEMRRPFAQLNIGTADYGDAASAGFIPTESYVKVPVYSKLNFTNGEVMGDAASVLFDYAEIPTTEAFPVTGYQYLAMNYLLVPASKETIEVEFGYNNAEGNGEEVRKVGAVPVQRNHRTNIYGNLMTSTIDIHVEINPEYDEPAYELDHVVFDALGLQEALNAAPAGATTTIHLGADIKGDVIEYQKADRHIVIEGGNHKYDGTIKIHNGSNYNDGSITINEVNFETEATQLDFIMAKDFGKEGNVTRRYSNNIFVTNCSFVALTANEGVVGVQVNATRNLQVLNCYANGLHSLVQAQSCGEDVIVKEAEIEGGKNGIAFKQVKNVVVEDVTIVAAAYGIRFDGNVDNYGITVKNVNVDANQPFIVRKMTGKDNTIALEGTNTLTTAKGYQIVITNGSDDETYVEPTGTYTLTGAEDFIVYPAAVCADSTADLQALLNNPIEGRTIILSKNVNYGQVIVGELKDVTIQGDENTVMIFKTDADTKIENVTLQGVRFEYTGATPDCGVVINAAAEIENLVIENCTFVGTGAKAGRGLYGQNTSANIVIKDCLFKDLGYPVYTMAAGGWESLVVENCKFDNIRSWAIMPQYGSYMGDLTVNGCEFVNCVGGLVKAGALTAGHTFTFTNNTINGCTVSGDHNWFSFNVSEGTSVVENNTKDGQPWTPTSANGLK